jgi:hypothetical protein
VVRKIDIDDGKINCLYLSGAKNEIKFPARPARRKSRVIFRVWIIKIQALFQAAELRAPGKNIKISGYYHRLVSRRYLYEMFNLPPSGSFHQRKMDEKKSQPGNVRLDDELLDPDREKVKIAWRYLFFCQYGVRLFSNNRNIPRNVPMIVFDRRRMIMIHP